MLANGNTSHRERLYNVISGDRGVQERGYCLKHPSSKGLGFY